MSGGMNLTCLPTVRDAPPSINSTVVFRSHASEFELGLLKAHS